MTSPSPSVLAVLSGTATVAGTPDAADPFIRAFTSAIWKRPREGRVAVSDLGLAGDEVHDRRHHGGPDQALLAYGAPNYAAWRAEGTLADTDPGSFGENLLVSDLTENDVCVGDVYRIGEVTVQVTKPREPCNTLAKRHQLRDLVVRVRANGRSGWYLRVLSTGTIGVGDRHSLLERPAPQWTVRRAQDLWHTRHERPAEARALLDCPGLAHNWKQQLLALGALAAFCLAPATISAQGLDAAGETRLRTMTPALAETRHDLHSHPELSNRETRTAGVVAARLRALGLEVRTGVAGTGVVGLLKGGRPGPLVAVRADMDALPVTEDTPFPFKSTVRSTYLGQEVGVSHACGHDLHVTIALGLAELLAAQKERLAGSVQFIFQPAEEGAPKGETGGAERMLKEGLWDTQKPAAVFGLHVSSDFPVGTIAFTPGAALSATDEFTLLVKGRPAHGARPDLSVDPIVTASQLVLALQTIRSRNVHPLQPAIVTVGLIRGGERANIIPETVTLIGTVRTYDRETQDLIERRMREVADGVTRAAGATYELDYHRQYPVTINDTALTLRSAAALRRALGNDAVRQVPPWTPAEDFSFFAQQVPGFYFRVGAVAAGTTSGGHHTPTFQASDDAIPVGVRAMATVVLDYLGGAR